MTCPFCRHRQDRVIDSRESKEGDLIRRRRECLKCLRRFTTYERSDEIPYMVVKRDGRRERFDRQKVLEGLLRACEKRPVPVAKLAEVVDAVESALAEEGVTFHERVFPPLVTLCVFLSQVLDPVMRGHSEWSAGERELFAGFTSLLNQCPF